MREFEPIPAIDILDGKCVRLKKGDYSQDTVYGDPVERALEFVANGAKRIHLVDLDGARAGKPSNTGVVESLVNAVRQRSSGVAIQLGGGMRDSDSIASTLSMGIDYAIVGTAAIDDRAFLEAATAGHPGKIILGLDERKGALATQGWTRESSKGALEFAKQAGALGIAGIIHTDIERDGMLTGPNQQATAALADGVDCPVYASGGISCLGDIDALRGTNIAGAIIGKAILEGRISLPELFHQPGESHA